MEHGLNTDFTNAGPNPSLIRVPSVARFSCFLRDESDPILRAIISAEITFCSARQAVPDVLNER